MFNVITNLGCIGSAKTLGAAKDWARRVFVNDPRVHEVHITSEATGQRVTTLKECAWWDADASEEYVEVLRVPAEVCVTEGGSR